MVCLDAFKKHDMNTTETLLAQAETVQNNEAIAPETAEQTGF